MPRGIPNRTFDATEQQIGQKVSVDIPTTGSLEGIKRDDQKLESETVDIVREGLDDSYAAQLAFMEEPVDVMVHETTDPNEQMLVDVYCNGIPQRFIRGQVQTVKRKYVEILARAKQTSIATRTVTTTDDVINRIDKHTALRYPFSVAHDPNPRGAAWLKSVLASA